MSDEERKQVAGELSASLAALPNVERTTDQLLTWLEIDRTIVELIAMHQEAEERIAELTAGPVPFLKEDEYQSIEDATLERDTIAKEIEVYMRAEVAKVDGIARFRNFLNRMVDASKGEKDRAAARHKSWENRKASLDGFILSAMDVMGKTRVETAANRLRIQNNPESVEITDPARIGDEFVEVQLTCTLATYKRMANEEAMLKLLREMDSAFAKDFKSQVCGLVAAAVTRYRTTILGTEHFKRGAQTFKLSAIAAAIKETQQQPCERCKGTKVESNEAAAVMLGASATVACRPCFGTGFKRFAGARLTRGRHVRCE